MRDLFTRKALPRIIARVNYRRRGPQALATAIALTLLNLLVTVGHATLNPTSGSTIGTISAVGVVKIDGSQVTSGQTLFSGSGIVTGARSESSLDLANLTRLKLDQETSVTLQSTKLSFSAALENGAMRALVPAAVRGDIRTSDAVITTDPGHDSAFIVTADTCSTTLIVQTGRVEIRAGDHVRSVFSGEQFSTDTGAAVPPPPHLSNRKKIGLFVGIGGAIAILLIALTGKDKAAVTETPGGGCVIILSPTTGGGGCS